jgi:hypothetical protein
MSKDIHVSKVKENSVAERVGLLRGDIVVQVNGQKMHPYELKRVSAKETITMDVRRVCRDLWGKRFDERYSCIKDVARAADQNVRWRRMMEVRREIWSKRERERERERWLKTYSPSFLRAGPNGDC